GREALAKIKELKPRVAVLDIQMPELDGFGVARAVRDEGLPVEIVFLTVYRDEDVFNAALDLGVKGYVLKDSAVSDVVACVRAVAAGQHYASPALTLSSPGGDTMNARRKIDAVRKSLAVVLALALPA